MTLTSSSTSGNTWSNGSTTQSITVTQSGNYTVSVSNGSCSATSNQIAVTVNTLPAVSLSPFKELCDTSGVVQLTGGSPAGGIFSGISVTNNTFNAGIGSGTYLIQYTYTDVNGCSSGTSQYLQVKSCKTSSLQESIVNRVQIYPNPAMDEFVIIVPLELTGSTYSLIDARGSVVRIGVINDKEESVEISKLAGGTYYLKIDSISELYRLVKQ